jgi:energy-coupling factor transporter ATP-binding protein EcfA2
VAGTIQIDGRNIRDVTLNSLRRHIGVVQQDVYLFAGTIAENLRYGRPEATEDDIVRAAKAADADGFISALPNGYDTDIGQRGVKLSGGQKQRLTIARAILKDPAILIFDEATSALDNESERAIQRSLATLARGRTTIVIAHRLSTVRNADRVLVLASHGIIEDGTHDALIARGGAYAALHDARAGVWGRPVPAAAAAIRPAHSAAASSGALGGMPTPKSSTRPSGASSICFTSNGAPLPICAVEAVTRSVARRGVCVSGITAPATSSSRVWPRP